MAKHFLVTSIIFNKCPKCRQGNLFKTQNPYNFKHFMDMPEYCVKCGQKTELEVGFYYGTGYVSYAITILYSAFNFLWYWWIFGLSIWDNSLLWYLLVNGILLIISTPFLMRLSRTLWLSFFVKYDKHAVIKFKEKMLKAEME